MFSGLHQHKSYSGQSFANPLAAFAFLNHTSDAVHGTVRTGECAVSRNMISLQKITPNLPCVTCYASLRSPPFRSVYFTSVRLSLCIRLHGSLKRFLEPCVGRIHEGLEGIDLIEVLGTHGDFSGLA